MEESFRKPFLVGWRDLDANAHMANTAYLDKAVDVRMSWFAEHGFPASELARRGFGPVVQTETLTYRRELRLLELVSVSFEIAGLAVDGSRMRLRNAFFRPDGELAATLESSGGWLDLKTRRLIAPPEDFLAVMKAAPRASDFEELPTSVRLPSQGG